MNEKNKQEEIQTRREFFKKAAKTALPVLGAAILSSVPFADATAQWGCYGMCSSNCTGSCEGGCNDSCYGSCKGTCNASCKWGSLL